MDQTMGPSTPNRPIRTCVSWFWTSWKWEFAACLLVLATPIIMFGTLYPHSGQPLPQWPFRISINSLLFVYALVLKAAIGFILASCIGQLQWNWFSETRPLTDMLHFDNATRGADGALGLIWRQRFRQPLTALGCIIMVLVVTVDPFVQQLVRPVDCSIEVLGGSAAATLPRTNVFEGRDYYEIANDTDQNNTTSMATMQKAAESALYNGLFSPGQDPPWQCSTGNCTFTHTYGTIGLCYSCQDASMDVSITATCSDPNSSYASHNPTSAADCPANSNFTVESNLTAGANIKLGTKMTILSNGIFDTPVVADAFSEWEYERSEYSSSGFLFGFLIGATASSGGRTDWTTSDSSACDSNGSKGSWGCQGFGAATCSLQPCVQIYNATISAGVLEEHLVASSSDTAWGTLSDEDGQTLYLTLMDTQCSAQNQTSLFQPSTTESRWLSYNLTLTDQEVDLYSTNEQPKSSLPSHVRSLLDSGCLYLMSPLDIMSSLENYLRGTIWANGGISQVEGGTAAGATVIWLSDFEGPELIQGLYNWGQTSFERVQSIFANISDSFTNYIRTHGGRPQLSGNTNFARDAQGQAYHYAICLKVQWPWISLPASLAVFTAVFFLAVAEATNRQGTPTWKSSPLAWILKVDGLGYEQFSSSIRPSEAMKERSRQIAVHILGEELDGPRICMADFKDPNLL